MTTAILSCVHANLPALEAVLAHARSIGATEIVSLGDIVGYGSQPVECLSLLKDVEISILGNHEEAILYYGHDFNPEAEDSLHTTVGRLSPPELSPTASHDLWMALGRMQPVVERDGVLFTHGSPRAPTREYVVPADAGNVEKMAGIFDLIERTCFVGHAHIAHAYASSGWHASPEEVGIRLDLREHAGSKTLINVGSVGQSRDGDSAASYVTFDGDVVRFHRVDYRASAQDPVPS